MTVQNIRFGDEGQLATRELVRRFEALAEEFAGLAEGPLAGYLRTLESIDRQYGGSAALRLEDAGDLVDAALAEAGRMEMAARRPELAPARGPVADVALGVALWAMRHEVAVRAAEPVANALALRSNRAGSKQELAAVFGLMQGFIAHVAPALAADLERSDPERPWRILHANFAITAIRTEDAAMMDYAFDALDRALPDERGGFYAEALALAMRPGFPPAVRERIEARHLQWTLR